MKPVCPRCKHKGITIKDPGPDKPIKRPQISCNNCGDCWEFGLDGGPFVTSKFANDLRETK